MVRGAVIASRHSFSVLRHSGEAVFVLKLQVSNVLPVSAGASCSGRSTSTHWWTFEVLYQIYIPVHLLILLIRSIIHVIVIPMATEDEVSNDRYLNYLHNFQASILVCLGLHPPYKSTSSTQQLNSMRLLYPRISM